MSFLKELKRRNVFKVGVAYLVACWLALQIADLVLENIHAPDWVMQVFMLGMAIGFPFALIVAWAFEVTPEGVKLHKNVDPEKSILRHTGHQLNRGIIVILSMAIVLLLTDKFRDELLDAAEPGGDKTEQSSESTGELQADVDTTSIAVLPFRDMSATQDQAYFGEGIAEELLNALVKIKGLDVASRTSSFSLAGENLDTRAIATKLGVNHILEGSVRTSGQKVRVTAQLIDADRDVHLWSETYDGSLDDIFKIQDEITGKIAAELKVQLVGNDQPTSTKLLTENAQAYQLYLQGRHLWRQRNGASIRDAIELFKQAVQLDPGFARAWSNLAIAYVNLPNYDPSYDANQGMELGLDAAEHALNLAPRSSEALLIKANYMDFHCDKAEAARLYKQAISYNPEDPTAHHWYASFLEQAGRSSLALEHIQIARALDPLISAVMAVEGLIYQDMGDYSRANELFRKAASLGFGDSSFWLGMNYIYAGEIEKGKALIEESLPGVGPDMTTTRRLFLQALTDPSKRAAFENHIGVADKSNLYLVILNTNLLSILDPPHVFEYLADMECPSQGWGVWAPRFREQRGTPEFFELMQRAGNVDYWREFGWPDDCASLDQALAECP